MSDFKEGFGTATGVELLHLASEIAAFCGNADPNSAGAVNGDMPNERDILEALVNYQGAFCWVKENEPD